MTTITIDRATVEQALECLKGVARGKYDGNAAGVCAALEAAMAQQVEPVQKSSAFTKDWCLRMAQIEMDAGAEMEIGPDLAQQAEPVAQCSFPTCQTTGGCVGACTRAALAQQAEPVQEWVSMDEYKRLQGLVTSQGIRLMEYESKQPQQAEPVEPYCYVYEYDGVFGLHREFYPFPYNGMKPSRTVPVYTAPPQQAEPVEQTCTWQQDGDSDSGVYGTSCGRYFNIEDGTPEDNKMAWCCYCGKKLAQELITENKDD